MISWLWVSKSAVSDKPNQWQGRVCQLAGPEMAYQ